MYCTRDAIELTAQRSGRDARFPATGIKVKNARACRPKTPRHAASHARGHRVLLADHVLVALAEEVGVVGVAADRGPVIAKVVKAIVLVRTDHDLGCMLEVSLEPTRVAVKGVKAPLQRSLDLGKMT